MEPDTLDINEFFDGLNVRIVGTIEKPYFYSCDMGKILGIANTRQVVLHYDDEETLSIDEKKKLNIITRDIHGNINESIVLLTEAGAYRMLFSSRKEIAIKFRRFVANLLYETRLLTKTKLQEKITQIEATTTKYMSEIIEQKEKLSKMENDIHAHNLANEFQGMLINKYRSVK
ncbi:MAG: Bro-N domain-containing protein [Candidatus Aenigmarchaeota archaeon]|nr:Bro-N domain-containing protein [Candidatus Aenigmarchaeota archaeon]